MKDKIDIPFGAHDSELKGWEYTIPEGMEAIIKDGKVIVREKESKDEKIRRQLINVCNDWLNGDYSARPCLNDIKWLKNLLEKQKINIEGDFGRGYDCGYEACLNSHGAEWFEKQKEKSEKLIIPEKENEAMKAIESIIRVYGKTQGEWIAGYDMDTLVVHLRKAFAALEKQKEQSITAKSLDEEIRRFFDDCIDVHEAKLYGSISERVIPVDCYELTARHFAKWGEKQKEQSLRDFIDDFPYSDEQKEQKPTEWSEEDERMLEVISYKISQHQGNDERSLFTPDEAEFICGMEDKLKSLRPSWNPSEEQMMMLLAVINEPNNAGAESCHIALMSLYNDLKKLI